MTPNDIEVLIHHHVSPEPHPRAHALAIQESIRMFIINGIFEPREGGNHRTTQKGDALVRMLCNLKWPQKAWIDEDDNVILRTE